MNDIKIPVLPEIAVVVILDSREEIPVKGRWYVNGETGEFRCRAMLNVNYGRAIQGFDYVLPDGTRCRGSRREILARTHPVTKYGAMILETEFPIREWIRDHNAR